MFGLMANFERGILIGLESRPNRPIGNPNALGSGPQQGRGISIDALFVYRKWRDARMRVMVTDSRVSFLLRVMLFLLVCVLKGARPSRQDLTCRLEVFSSRFTGTQDALPLNLFAHALDPQRDRAQSHRGRDTEDTRWNKRSDDCVTEAWGPRAEVPTCGEVREQKGLRRIPRDHHSGRENKKDKCDSAKTCPHRVLLCLGHVQVQAGSSSASLPCSWSCFR